MSEDVTATSETLTEDGFKPITTQAELDALMGERAKRERAKFADYKDLKAKAEAFDKAEAEKMSEIEKANKRAEEAERVAEALRAETEISQLAADNGIPRDALVGTPEERAKAIKKLIEGVTKSKAPEPDPTQGRGNPLPLNGDGLEQLLRQKLGIK